MRSDDAIKKYVEEEINWDPSINSTDIAIKVNKGIVALTGFAPSYIDKYEAERAAKRIQGVHGVANDIVVQLPSSNERPDPEIAREAIDLLKSQLPLCWDKITILTHQGNVSIEGEVDWHFQKDVAENVLHRLSGVKKLTNNLSVRTKITSHEVKNRIISAFHRSAQIDANNIQVDLKGSEVTLKGSVRSWAEHDEAQRATWAAPGITRVINQISVS